MGCQGTRSVTALGTVRAVPDDPVLTDTAHDNKMYRGKEQVRTYETNECVIVTDDEKHFSGLEVLNPLRTPR